MFQQIHKWRLVSGASQTVMHAYFYLGREHSVAHTNNSIQFCATTVVLISIFTIIVYQIMTGHQYFIARRWLMDKEQAQQKEDQNLIRFNTDHEAKMEKFA